MQGIIIYHIEQLSIWLLTILRLFTKLTALLFFLLLISNISFSKPERIVRVGVYQNEPKIYLDQTGKPSGLFVEFLNEIAKNENWNLIYIPCQWEDCLDALYKGEIDLMPDVALTPERDIKFDFNKISVIDSWSQIYTKPESNIVRISDLEGKSIAFLESSIQLANFKRRMDGFSISYTAIPVETFDQGFALVQNDSADAVVCNHFYGDMFYSKFGLKKTPLIFDPVSLYFAVKENHNEDILNIIDNYIEDWTNQSNSFYYETLARYLDKTEEQSWSFSTAILLTTSSILILVTLFFVIRKHKSIKNKKNEHNKNLLAKAEINKFKRYFESIPLGVFITDDKSNCVEVNNTASDITGFTKEELTGKNFKDFVAQDSLKAAINHFEKLSKFGNATDSYSILTKNGNKKYLIIESAIVSGSRFLSIVTDITKKIETENELRNLNNKLKQELKQKTNELQKRIKELEHFHEVTIEREFRVNELKNEIKRLKGINNES